jgi:hypothetical protein
MSRLIRGGAAVETVLVMPLLLLIIGGCFTFLSGAWKDVWRARRYSLPISEPPASSTELAVLPPWRAPFDRRVARINLQQRIWTKRGQEIWSEVEVRRDDE